MAAREKLTRLIELASREAPDARRALAQELCDLLLDWPPTYPDSMREPFEALLEKTLRVIDAQTRNALAWRVAERRDAPLSLLNEFYFGAGAELRKAILMHNAYANGESAHDPEPADLEQATLGASLVQAARTTPQEQLPSRLAALCGLDDEIATRILHDASGEGLAVLARGARLGRAAFSALALLTESAGDPERKLGIFDSVPQAGAEALFRFWRQRAASAMQGHPFDQPAHAALANA